MAVTTIPNAVLIRLLWDLGGFLAINVIGALKQGVTVNQALAEALGTAIKTGWTSSGYKVLCPPSTQLMKIGVRDMSVPNAAEFFDTGAVVPGTSTNLEMLPRQVALCTTVRTAQSGKSYRGRNYWGGFDEVQNTATKDASAAAKTAVGNFMGSIANAMIASGMKMAVVSRPADAYTKTIIKNPNTPEAETVTKHYPARAGFATEATATQVRDGQWDTQRRRNNGRGSSAVGSLLTQGELVALP